VANGGTGGATFTPTPSFADNETPSGVIDGANDTFRLLNSPSPPESLMLVKRTAAGSGLMQLAGGIDYTLVGSKIVFTSAAKPQTGDDLRAWYRYTQLPPGIGAFAREQEAGRWVDWRALQSDDEEKH
jgi:hypothetical protein